MNNQEDFVRVAEYEEEFLQSRELKTRQCVYISRDTQEIIANIVHRLGQRGLSIGAYIDTILQQHLQDHKEEINELYCKSMDKLIK
ncbi:MAG: DUF3408 domain-containing protein [Tannerellaceae bacterium]|jgi:hypothetical protein|nr:DUF3408 domain-containing protein [Tannerellaceae bacterium]